LRLNTRTVPEGDCYTCNKRCGQDHINPFLYVVFEGKTPEQYENENGRSAFGLIDTIKKLEEYHRA